MTILSAVTFWRLQSDDGSNISNHRQHSQTGVVIAGDVAAPAGSAHS